MKPLFLVKWLDLGTPKGCMINPISASVRLFYNPLKSFLDELIKTREMFDEKY